MSDIVKRNPANPILTPDDLQPSAPGMMIEGLLNPGVFHFQDKTWMLIRVAERPRRKPGYISVPFISNAGIVEQMDIALDAAGLKTGDPRVIQHNGNDYLTTLSHLRLLCSHDGVSFYEPEQRVSLPGTGPLETFGIEDCRVALIDNTYYLSYTAVSSLGVGVGLMTTSDWRVFERKGMILPPHNKDCAIFEKKIGSKYYMLHRPSSVFLGGNYIWMAESPDLAHWGNHTCIATTRKGKWDSERIGAGAAPILTSEGWLEIYHGADHDQRYCLGALLLDSNDPSKVIARSDAPVMEPVAEYERKGFFGNVVFTNGHLLDGDTLRIYYGASDSVICSADLSVSAVLNSLS